MTASNLETLDVVEVMALTGSLPIHSLKSRPIIIGGGGGGGESKVLEACHQKNFNLIKPFSLYYSKPHKHTLCGSKQV